MTWHAPKTDWADGDLPSAAAFNRYLRDNLSHLYEGDITEAFAVATLESDVVVNSSITLADTGLLFSIQASEWWAYVVQGVCTTNVTADTRWQTSVPSGAVGDHAIYVHNGTGSADSIGTDLTPPASVNSDVPFLYFGSLVNSSEDGDVEVQFAQRVSTGTNTTIYAGATLFAIKITGVGA